MNKKQRDIILGTLLGDGWIEKQGSIRFKQCLKHKEYIFWLYGELKNLCRSSPTQRRDNKQWYFQTRSNDETRFYRSIFYRGVKKRVPKNIGKLIKSALSLAIWFMDDGTIDWREKSHYAFRLTTNCFSMSDNRLLIEMLKKRFGVKTTLQTTLIRGKRYPRIYIGKDGRGKFANLIEPFVLNCFRYKLPPFLRNPSETVR